MGIDNAQQITDWNGHSGQRWVAHQDWLDRMLASFGDAAIDAATPLQGDHVLDIGCGSGTTSLALAALVGATGHVIGVDISEPLIERARDRASRDHMITFRLEDASLAPLPIAAFDLLFSRFGVMFFDDAAAAFAHLRRSLKPGGRLAFVCWRGADENDWITLPLGAIGDILPPASPPPPGTPGPFSFGDRDRVTDILERAGFSDIGLAPFDHDIVFGHGTTDEAAIDDALHMALEVGPLSRALADQPDPVRARAMDAVRTAFAAKVRDKAVVIHGAAWIVTARNTPG